MSIETLLSPTETKAAKDHLCNFCAEKIRKGEVYMNSTHVHEGAIYSWKAHKYCSALADRLKMYEDADDGVTDEMFQETINCEHDDLLISLFPKEERNKYTDVIQQLRHVKFRDKLWYVIRHYAKIDKENDSKPTTPSAP